MSYYKRFSNQPELIQRKMFDFVSAIYRVTDCLPQAEPLRNKLRETALELVRVQGPTAGLSCVSALRSFIAISEQNNIMKHINAMVLERECFVLESYFSNELNELKAIPHSRKMEKNAARLSNTQNDNFIINDTMSFISKSDSINKSNQSDELNKSDNSIERQEAIIDYLKVNKEGRINDFATMFSNRFSLKTLQRDIAYLMSHKVVDRQGDKRWAVYRLNGV